MAQLTTLRIDTAKQVFQLHGGDQQGNVVLHKHISRTQGLPLLAQVPPCLHIHTLHCGPDLISPVMLRLAEHGTNA